MSLIELLVAVIIVGVLLWLINLIPMNNTIKNILNAVVIIVAILWVLSVFGVIDSHYTIRIG